MSNPAQPNFSQTAAQKYEKASAEQTILKHFAIVYQQWEEATSKGSLWQTENDIWFQGDVKLWRGFVDYVKDKKCLEIGSGPFGYIGGCYWISNRYIIDPLIDFYREAELRVLGKTFFTEDIKTYNCPAEQIIEELVGEINGFIMCRNALDHCEDSLVILENISRYAKSGCYFLLWTDVWHASLDEGHHNITKSLHVMDILLKGLGFEIMNNTPSVRDDPNYLEYGRLFRKI